MKKQLKELESGNSYLVSSLGYISWGKDKLIHISIIKVTEFGCELLFKDSDTPVWYKNTAEARVVEDLGKSPEPGLLESHSI